MRVGLCLFFVIFSLSAGAQKEKDYSCTWHHNDATILESRVSDFKFSEKGLFYYRILNDSVNIYIQVKVFDDDVKRDILLSGLTVWVDPSGKRTKKTGIKYPAGMNGATAEGREERRPDNEKGNTGQPERAGSDRMTAGNGKASDQNDIVTVNSSIMLIGFPGEDSLIIRSPEPGDFHGSVFSGDDQYLYYELTLPIRLLPQFYTAKQQKRAKLAIGFSHLSSGSTALLNNMADNRGSRPSSDNEMSGMGGGRPPMGGGMQGMGGGMPSMGGGMPSMGGGMPSGSQGMRDSQTPAGEAKSGKMTTVIFWIKHIKLATNNL